jgi:hypothetical protein
MGGATALGTRMPWPAEDDVAERVLGCLGIDCQLADSQPPFLL